MSTQDLSEINPKILSIMPLAAKLMFTWLRDDDTVILAALAPQGLLVQKCPTNLGYAIRGLVGELQLCSGIVSK